MITKAAKTIFKQLGYSLTLSPIAKNTVNNKIAFIHLAKCGGISIDNALRSQFANPGDKRVCRETSIASSIFSFKSELQTLEQCCDFSEHHLNHMQGILDHFANSSQNYISGHWPVNTTLLGKYHTKRDFITVLREPEARLKSNYIFNKLSNSLTIMPPSNLDTDNIIAEAKEIIFGRRGWQLATTQTAYLTGKYPKDQNESEVLQKELIQNLSKFKLIGFLEDLSSFEKKFEAQYNGILNIKMRNATSRLEEPSKQQILDDLTQFFDDRSTKQHLAKICKTESKSYMLAKELYFE